MFFAFSSHFTKNSYLGDVTNHKQQINTFESPVKPSFTLGIIRMCVGAWGSMSLKAKTCKERQKMDEYKSQN